MKRWMLSLLAVLAIFAGCSRNRGDNIRSISEPSDLIGEPSQIHIVLNSQEMILDSNTEEYEEILGLLKERFPKSPEKLQQAQLAILWADQNGLNWDMMCEQFDFLQLRYEEPQTITMEFKEKDAPDYTITFDELVFPLSEYIDIFCVATEQAGMRCYGPLNRECIDALRSYWKS